MIRTIVTHSCPKCESPNLVKNGHDYKGAQKYHCKSCGSYGTLQAQQGYSEQLRAQIKRALLERVSLRGMARIFAISRRTIGRWLEQWAAQVPAVWLALCRRTRQVVAYWLGDRSASRVRHSLFLNVMICMMAWCACLSVTTIAHVSVKMSPLPSFDASVSVVRFAHMPFASVRLTGFPLA